MRAASAVLCIGLALAACAEEVAPGVRSAPLKVWREANLGPVRAKLEGQAGPFRFGQRVIFVLSIDAQPDAALDAPAFGVRLGHLRVRDEQILEQTATRRVHRFEVDAERLGENLFVLPPLSFRVLAGEGANETRELVLEPLSLDFPASEVLPDLAAIAAPLAPPPWTEREDQKPWWIALVLALALAGGTAFWLLRRRPTEATVQPIDPSAEASAALARLLASDLLARKAYAAFYVELTRIVRVYIERTTGISAPDLTTEEFMEAARRYEDAILPAQRAELERFLAASDLIKYAGQSPSDAEIDAAVQAARRFCRVGASSPAEAVA